MAHSYQSVVSNGTLTTLLLTIEYGSRSEISVYFNGVLSTAWAWVGTTEKQISFGTAVPAGVVVLVKRTTNLDAPKHVFSTGAQFKAAAVDANTMQLLRAAQENREVGSVQDFGAAAFAPDLASTDAGKGASLVGYSTTGGSVKAALDAQAADIAQRLPEIGTYVLLRAYSGPLTAFYVRGRSHIFDGASGPFRVDASDTSSADNGVTILVDAVGRRWKREESEHINIRWAGALPGGSAASNTAAIQKALDVAVGRSVLVPDGVFQANALTISNTLTLTVVGTLQYAALDGVFITITAANTKLVGSGELDLNGTQNKGVLVSADDCEVAGLTIRNMLGGAATGGSTSAVNAQNCARFNLHDVRFFDLKRGAAPGPFVSQPRAVSLDICTDAHVCDVTIKNALAAFAVAGCTGVYIDNPVVFGGPGVVDNAFYLIGSTDVHISNPTISGWGDEPIVFSGCTRAYVHGGKIVGNHTNSCGFENSTDFGFLGTTFVGDNFASVIKARIANVSSSGLSLVGCKAYLRCTSDVVGFYNGAINNLTIKGNLFVVTYDTGKTFSNRFLHLTNTDAFIIDDNTWVFGEIAAAPAADFTVTLVATGYSSFKGNRFINRTAAGRIRVLGTENNLIASDDLHNQADISGSRNANYGLATAEPRTFYGTAVPTAGTFIRGDKIINTAPSAGGSVGWVCTSGGSPGTWKTFGAIAA